MITPLRQAAQPLVRGRRSGRWTGAVLALTAACLSLSLAAGRDRLVLEQPRRPILMPACFGRGRWDTHNKTKVKWWEEDDGGKCRTQVERFWKASSVLCFIMLQCHFILAVSLASKYETCFSYAVYLFCSFFNKIRADRQEKCSISQYETTGHPEIGRRAVFDD